MISFGSWRPKETPSTTRRSRTRGTSSPAPWATPERSTTSSEGPEMQREIGTAQDCPNCKGKRFMSSHRKCTVCNAEGRVEYQEKDGEIFAPAGSWLPTRRRGRTGYLIVLWGGVKQSQVR